jgi:hypothetical protein
VAKFPDLIKRESKYRSGFTISDGAIGGLSNPGRRATCRSGNSVRTTETTSPAGLHASVSNPLSWMSRAVDRRSQVHRAVDRHWWPHPYDPRRNDRRWIAAGLYSRGQARRRRCLGRAGQALPAVGALLRRRYPRMLDVTRTMMAIRPGHSHCVRGASCAAPHVETGRSLCHSPGPLGTCGEHNRCPGKMRPHQTDPCGEDGHLLAAMHLPNSLFI